VIRRATKALPHQGGWNIFRAGWADVDMMNRVVE
jgi:hypothetical protein